ncbi:MAG: hypothetical protein DSM106950_19360 [Stigonema ocellatum SAG 48.90 = DSM 106950]|nr:hypothetical protein [Stigonema ocellatum SAG 48.90 = DSM 106950]
MLQEASTHLIVLEPLEDLIASEPWSIESYADGLMDELFGDIDNILDGSGNQPEKILQQGTVHLKSGNPYGSRLKSATDFERTGVENPPTALPLEYVPLETVRLPQIVLPQTQVLSVQGVRQVRKKQFSTILVDSAGVTLNSKLRQKWRHTLGKLLSVGVTVGLVITAIIWALHSKLLNRLMTQSFQQSVLEQQPQLLTTAAVESDLVDYIIGSLAAIDRQAANRNQKYAKTLLTSVPSANQTAFTYLSSRPTGNLPQPLAANNTPPVPGRSTTLVERIYIPVYQAPQPMRYAPPPILGAFNPFSQLALGAKKMAPNASQLSPVKTALNTVPKQAKPVTVTQQAAVRPQLKPVPVRTTPITLGQPPKPIPVLPASKSRVAPTAEPSPSLTREEMLSVASAPVVSVPSHILEGLLELGNKSAALFKIDGITRRVHVGESIGGSGWTLVDVANGEAVIRRNGEVRSIYTGQKF